MLDSLDIRILVCDNIRIDTNWDSQDVYSSYWRLYLNDSAGAAIHWKGGIWPIEPGRVCFLPAWLRFSCENTAEVNHFYIHFDLGGLPGILQRKLFDRPITLDREESYSSVISEVFRYPPEHSPETTANRLAMQWRVKAYACRQLAALLESLDADGNEILDRFFSADPRFAGVLEFIDSNLARQLDNAHLAHHCHMSRSHFVRWFATHAHMPPAKYVQERRIAKASQLLTFTHLPIEQITEQTGFANRFHFTRIFTTHMNTSPAAYRNTPQV